MDGQMSLFDFIKPEKHKITAECAGCKYKVWLNIDGLRKAKCDSQVGCKYTPRSGSCYSCEFYRDVVDAYTSKKLGYKTCSHYDAWSVSKNVHPEMGCDMWKEKRC